MPAINNTVTNPGLVPTNPFLAGNAKTGGSTTGQFSPTQASPIGAAANGLLSLSTNSPSYSAPFQSSTPTQTGFPAPNTIPGSGTAGMKIIPNSISSQASGITGGTSTGTGQMTTQQVLDQLSQAKTTLLGLQSKLNTPSTTTPTNTTGTSQGLGMGGGKAPDGMMYDGQGKLVPISTMQNPYTNTGAPTYSGLVGSLASTASQPTQNFSDFQNTSKTAATNLLNSAPQQNQDVLAQKAQIQNLMDEYAKLQSDIAMTPGDLSLANGEQGALYNRFSGRLQALQTGLENILTGNAQQQAAYTGAGNVANTASTAATGQQSTQQSGLANAAGAAAPVQVPYSNQYINPVTGQPVGGGGSGASGSALAQLPAQAQNAIQSYAEQVRSGSMTRADAESRLSAYGIAGTNALNEVLGTGFNTNASNASAGTTAVGQQIQTAANSTNQALDTLAQSFNALPGFETGGIPATNSIANWIATQFGSSALTQYKTNLADARSQLIGVLNSSGGTPTGNEATANQYLPDNMTKAQFDQNVGTQQNPGIVRQLIQQKVSSFTSSGQQANGTTNTNTTAGNQPAGWF